MGFLKTKLREIPTNKEKEKKTTKKPKRLKAQGLDAGTAPLGSSANARVRQMAGPKAQKWKGAH